MAPAFISAFTLREVAFLVVMSVDSTSGFEVESKYLAQLWPFKGFIRWPLKRAIDASQFPALTDGHFPEQAAK